MAAPCNNADRGHAPMPVGAAWLAAPPHSRYVWHMRRAEQILDDAMQLSEEERGSLAAELLDSISAPDARSDSEWIAEIERRATRALTDDAQQDRTVEEAVSRIERDLDP